MPAASRMTVTDVLSPSTSIAPSVWGSARYVIVPTMPVSAATTMTSSTTRIRTRRLAMPTGDSLPDGDPARQPIRRDLSARFRR